MSNHINETLCWSGILALLTIDNAFKNSSKIEGIIYTHNDGTLNVTELSSGEYYPFPTDQIIATTGLANIRTKNKTNKKGQNKLAYRIFPDGHSETVNTQKSFDSITDVYGNLHLAS